jgi:hypothetical protein
MKDERREKGMPSEWWIYEGYMNEPKGVEPNAALIALRERFPGGTRVRHTKAPQWGIGTVVDRADGYTFGPEGVWVRFPGNEGRRYFAACLELVEPPADDQVSGREAIWEWGGQEPEPPLTD